MTVNIIMMLFSIGPPILLVLAVVLACDMPSNKDTPRRWWDA